MAKDEIIRVRCPNLSCRTILSVTAEARGKVVRCRVCQKTVRVPATRPKPPADDLAA